jgi:peptidoglycan-N-acetylglucosamine deacetylase
MRSKIAALCLLASFIGIGTAGAQECPAGALGVSRTLVVDPTEHVRLGSWQYPESLPLKDHEVVLTFDDGPLPAYTNRILDLLAAECVKATFFMVGRMVQAYPATVRRIHSEGHTIANHSMTHPFTFHKMSVDQASHEIEGAFAALRTALGDPNAVAPFFRFPGLLRQTSVEQYLAAHNYMAWSIDLAADDWTHINNKEVARRAISRLEARGKGILLLHDIQPATALAMPEILSELKARGFKIVHVVPATAERPKTVTAPELWAVRHTPSPEERIWPRAMVMGESPEPVLAAPSPASFGIESFGSAIKVAMVQTVERKVMNDAAEAALPPMTVWPRPASYPAPADATVLPVPAAHNFRYSRPFRLGPSEKPEKKVAGVANAAVAKKHATAARSREAAQPSGWFFGQQPAAGRKASGHQLSVTR